MNAKVDWLTYTLTVGGGDVEVSPYALYNALKPDYFPDGEGEVVGRRHAKLGMRHGEGYHIFVYASGAVSVELSGMACEDLRNSGMLHEICAKYAGRATRIDIACDFETDVRPKDIVDSSESSKLSSRSDNVSSTGETVYYGSRDSERYVRVYRYEPPHPRSELLRIEYVLKDRYAKEVCRMVSEGHTMADIARGASDRYRWSHSAVKTLTAPSAAELRPSAKTRGGATIRRWVVKQVAPAVMKAIASGDYSWGEFVADLDSYQRLNAAKLKSLRDKRDGA